MSQKLKSKRTIPSESKVDVATAMKFEFPVDTFVVNERDVILYALGIGAASDPLDPKELKFVYENHEDFSAFPTFGVVVPSAALNSATSIPGLSFHPMAILHGEQYMEVRNAIPTSGKLTNHAKLGGVFDKGSGALMIIQVTTKNEKGEDVLYNEYSLFIRGLGGFGGDKGPSPPDNSPPKRAPDVLHREVISENQNAIYRLSGDYNPLHIDPSMAKMGNFHRPILHGLCTFGYACRAVVKHFADNDTSLFKSVRVRFVKHVFPGETVITEMWQVSPTKVVFRVRVAERGEVVINNAMIEFTKPVQKPIQSKL